MNDQTPSNADQLMTQVLESVLPNALKPIVERQDRIEDLMIDQPPVTRDQLSHALSFQKQEILEQQLSNNQNLSDALIQLAERLGQREIERNQQLKAQSQQIAQLEQRLNSQQQSFNDLTKTLVTLSDGLNQLVSKTEQWHQQQNQQSEILNSDIDQRITTLVNTLIPLPEETRFVGEELSQRLDKQEQGLEELTTATNRLANELEALMKVLQP